MTSRKLFLALLTVGVLGGFIATYGILSYDLKMTDEFQRIANRNYWTAQYVNWNKMWKRRLGYSKDVYLYAVMIATSPIRENTVVEFLKVKP